jgi:hypothetical protein
MTKEHEIAMKRIRFVMLALLAVFCLSAVAATAAMANEGEFVKNGTAKTTKSPLAKANFKAKNSGTTTLETVGKSKVECTGLKAEGKQNTTETGEQTVHFTGCTSTFGIAKCEGGEEGTKKHEKEEIIVLTGVRTRRATQSTAEVLLLVQVFAPNTKKAGTFKFECAGKEVQSKGSFLVKTGTPEVPAKLFKFTAKQTKGVQEQKNFETAAGEKLTDTLETLPPGGSKFEQSGQGGTEEVEFEEEGEFV